MSEDRPAIYHRSYAHWRDQAQRKARMRAIHQIARQRRLIDGKDDSAYRAFIANTVPGKQSSADCTVDELGQLLDALNGNRARASTGVSPRDVPAGLEAQFTKVSALLTAAGKHWGYAEGIARKMHGKDRLQFCTADELRGVIAALERAKGRLQSGVATKEKH